MVNVIAMVWLKGCKPFPNTLGLVVSEAANVGDKILFGKLEDLCTKTIGASSTAELFAKYPLTVLPVSAEKEKEKVKEKEVAAVDSSEKSSAEEISK